VIWDCSLFSISTKFGVLEWPGLNVGFIFLILTT